MLIKYIDTSDSICNVQAQSSDVIFCYPSTAVRVLLGMGELSNLMMEHWQTFLAYI